MSYDIDMRAALAQATEDARSAKVERDMNYAELDRLRSRLRALVPDVAEGHDLVAALERRLALPPVAETGDRPCPRCGTVLEVYCPDCEWPRPLAASPAAGTATAAVPSAGAAIRVERYTGPQPSLEARGMALDKLLRGLFPLAPTQTSDFAVTRQLVAEVYRDLGRSIPSHPCGACGHAHSADSDGGPGPCKDTGCECPTWRDPAPSPAPSGDAPRCRVCGQGGVTLSDDGRCGPCYRLPELDLESGDAPKGET